eukprot:GHVU01015465.1.p1 GENE.GHVU01015465.1~~GHVU01015465.1.p1  ORF type:complete len:378 (+),score=51.13 GHVU01015465.1:215-1348(+)
MNVQRRGCKKVTMKTSVILLSLFVQLSINSLFALAAVTCPLGWKPTGARCFRAFALDKITGAESVTWREGMGYCATHGAALATIHNDVEDSAVRDAVRGLGFLDEKSAYRSCWMGLRRYPGFPNDKAWFWVDSTEALSQGDYHNWGAKERLKWTSAFDWDSPVCGYYNATMNGWGVVKCFGQPKKGVLPACAVCATLETAAASDGAPRSLWQIPSGAASFDSDENDAWVADRDSNAVDYSGSQEHLKAALGSGEADPAWRYEYSTTTTTTTTTAAMTTTTAAITTTTTTMADATTTTTTTKRSTQTTLPEGQDDDLDDDDLDLDQKVRPPDHSDGVLVGVAVGFASIAAVAFVVAGVIVYRRVQQQRRATDLLNGDT